MTMFPNRGPQNVSDTAMEDEAPLNISQMLNINNELKKKVLTSHNKARQT